jgi:uncharacterized membrane protein (DUF4010 family)
MEMVEIVLLERLGVALAAGLLIGLERGWHDRELAEGWRVAGLRTFGLIGLLGGLAAVLAELSGPLVLAGAFVGLGAVLAAGLWHAGRRRKDIGITTMVAAMTTLALGAAAGYGHIEIAAATAVVVTLLLGIKPELHGLLRRMEHRELMAVIQLLLISIVLLPVLPDRGYGPWQALNPYQLWWMVVLIAGISFVGYFAIRLFGTSLGLALTAVLGGLASSTAVTLNMARLGVTNRQSQPLLAATVVLSAATMFPRMLVVIAVVGPAVLAHLAVPLVAAWLVATAAALWAWRRSGALAGRPRIETRNPFELTVALQFGLLLGLIMVLAQAARHWLGDAGLYLLAAASGLGDVDAITLSFSAMAAEGQVEASLAAPVAARGILIAAAVNTLIKPILTLAICGPRMAFGVALPLVAALGVAAVLHGLGFGSP